MNKEESVLEKIRRHDYKLHESVLHSQELQEEIKQCLTMQNVSQKDIEIDKQR